MSMQNMGKVLVALVAALATSSVLLGFYQWRSMPVMFLLHVVGMILAWALMVVGSAVYKGASAKPRVRILHGVIQTIAFIAACLGYYGIYKQHELGGKRQFHIWPLTNAKTIHVLVGYLVLAGMIAQVCQGWARKFKMEAGVFTKYLMHPKQGRAVQVAAAANILLAVYFMPGIDITAVAMFCTVVLATLATMLPVKASGVTDLNLKQNLMGYSEMPNEALGA